MISDKAISISSKGHIDRCRNTGASGEDLFISLCNEHGIKCVKSDEKENIYNHTDFFIFDDKRVDVKGLKQAHKEGFLAVEFRNVAGKHGSCSDGSIVDYIAFQLESGFVILRKDELLKWCRINVKNEYASNWNDAILKLYTRQGRKDLVTKIPVDRIDEFKFAIILKH